MTPSTTPAAHPARVLGPLVGAAAIALIDQALKLVVLAVRPEILDDGWGRSS